MKWTAVMIACLVLAAFQAGCSEPTPAPPSGDPMANMPDEVREAETKFQDQAKHNSLKRSTKKIR